MTRKRAVSEAVVVASKNVPVNAGLGRIQERLYYIILVARFTESSAFMYKILLQLRYK